MISSPNNEPSLTSTISNEIAETSIDITIDYSEMILDNFLSDGILKEIPFVKTLYSIGKIGSSIKERFFIKKLFIFLKELHTQTVNPQKLIEFKTKFDSDENYKNTITEQIMIYLDSFLTNEKSKILAKLFSAYVEGHFDWSHFNHLSICLDSINPKAFVFLQQLASCNFKITEEPSQREIPRNGENEALLYACGVAYETSSWSSGFNISQLGKDLYNFGVK